MRIISRPDFDGIVCAALLFEAENIDLPTVWAQPTDIKDKAINIRQGDIIANLPYSKKCSLWFDHHYTNKIDVPFKGLYRLYPSAASLVLEYYRERFKKDYRKLVKETDKIDSADLSLDEIKHPEKNSFLILSMTVSETEKNQKHYWNKLTEMLREFDIDKIIQDFEVKKKIEKTIQDNKNLKELLLQHTYVKKDIAITDLRVLDKKVNISNRFSVYALFPNTKASLKIQKDTEKDRVNISIGHNIINPGCKINAGLLLSKFGGGGHAGAAGASLHAKNSQRFIEQIIKELTA